MKIVDELVCPHASYMLVEAHGPKRHDLALWIGVQLGQLLEKPTLNAALLGNAIERVVLHKSSVGLEVDGLRCARVDGAFCLGLQGMFRPQAVTDIDRAFYEACMFVDEVLVHPSGRNDVVGDIIEYGEVGARLEHDRNVSEIGTAVRERDSTATLTCGWLSRRSVSRVHRIGCISAMLEPQSTKASAASKSS